MDTNRKKVFSGTSQVKAMGIRNALDEKNIEFFEVDKSDSSYAGLFGTIEIYVNAEDETEALALITPLLD